MFRFIGDIGNGALLLALSICLAAVALTYGVSFLYEKLKKKPSGYTKDVTKE